jgi:hypothetical protein
MRMFRDLFLPSKDEVLSGQDVDGPATTLGQDLIPWPQLNSNLLVIAGALYRDAVENASGTWTQSGGQNPGTFGSVIKDG